MRKSNQWLNRAKQLCNEPGPEDGIDPRILARKSKSKTNCHKNQQLCKEAKRVMSLVLVGEIGDYLLQNLEVVDVTVNEDGRVIFVSVRHIDTGVIPDENEILNKLQAIQGYLRTAIAQSVKRKCVPSLKFQLMEAPSEVTSYAYSKNN